MSRRDRRSRHHTDPSSQSTSLEGEPTVEPGHRQARLEHVLLDELQSLIRDEASDPSLHGVQLLGVQLSPDAGHARVAYAVVASLDREREVGPASLAGLKRATSFLRARLAQQLNLKKLPQLGFAFVGVASPDLAAGDA
jgi:ribosome-binding factor A